VLKPALSCSTAPPLFGGSISVDGRSLRGHDLGDTVSYEYDPTPMPQFVRKARPADLQEVKALMEETWSLSNSELLPDFTVKQLIGENSISMLIQNRWPDLWIAEDENTLLGVLGATQEGYIWACYVRLDRQRQGIGGALMSAAEGYFRDLGLSDLTLDILEGNTAAEMFYRSRGWLENSRKAEHLPGHTATSIHFSFSLIKPKDS